MDNPDKIPSIELRSHEVKEILSRPPHSLVRWGTSLIGAIIILFFAASFFFCYPDVVTSSVTITTQNPPAWVMARSTGKLAELYRKDHEAVNKGSIIAVMENPARTKDVLELKKWMAKHASADSVLLQAEPPAGLKLGMVQSAYSVWLKALTDYKNFLSLALYDHKIGAAQRQLKEYDTYLSHLQNQISMSRKNIALVEKDYKREMQLFDKGLSSQATLEESGRTLVSARQNTEQLLTGLSSARIEKARLSGTLAELMLQQQQEERQLRTRLQTALEDVWVAVRNWEQAYLLTAPCKGILSYNEVWDENQNIESGEKVFSVVSSAPGRIIGRVRIPANGSGKVKAGQRVNIKVDGDRKSVV